jgi:hypothetical protein
MRSLLLSFARKSLSLEFFAKIIGYFQRLTNQEKENCV